MNQTPNEIVRALTDTDLRPCVLEALEWRAKGVLSGQALRGLAERLVTEAGVDDLDANRMADSIVVEEAATRFGRQSGQTRRSA